MVVRGLLLGLIGLVLLSGCLAPYPRYYYGHNICYRDYGYRFMWVEAYNCTKIPINCIEVRSGNGELIPLALVGQPFLPPGKYGRFEVWVPVSTWIGLDCGYEIVGYKRL
jgi:hypothetical protein